MRYRLQRHDGTDCSATMVPLQCYAWYRFSAIVNFTLLVIYRVVGKINTFFSYYLR